MERWKVVTMVIVATVKQEILPKQYRLNQASQTIKVGWYPSVCGVVKFRVVDQWEYALTLVVWVSASRVPLTGVPRS